MLAEAVRKLCVIVDRSNTPNDKTVRRLVINFEEIVKWRKNN